MFNQEEIAASYYEATGNSPRPTPTDFKQYFETSFETIDGIALRYQEETR